MLLSNKKACVLDYYISGKPSYYKSEYPSYLEYEVIWQFISGRWI